MKTLRFALLIFAVAAFTCSSKAWGQKVVHEIITVHIYAMDYDVICPGIGTVSGTYKYHFLYKLNKAGFIESIHWNAYDFDLSNGEGKIIVCDAGHDNYGVLWTWFNTPDYMNGYSPYIDYDCVEGRLDPLIGPNYLDEGVAIEIGCKILYKGLMLKLPFMALLHINANGVTTVDVVRP